MLLGFIRSQLFGRKKESYLEHYNIVCDRYKFIYFFIPKVACSSLKKICADILGLKIRTDKKYKEEDEAVHYLDFPFARQHELETKYRDYFKFGFVRNPWDRLLSCYANKILADSSVNDAIYERGVFRGFVRYNVFSAGMSFDAFVEAVAEIPDEEADEHFMSQHKFITDERGLSLVDFVGKFENLSGDYERIRKKLGLNNYTLPHLKKTSHKDYHAYYNKEMQKITRRRYKDDIEMFGYYF